MNRLIGFDLNTELDRLEKLCEEKGVEHKDFAGRNIIVPWDFDSNRADMDPSKPRMYLIDWEQNPKSPKEAVSEGEDS